MRKTAPSRQSLLLTVLCTLLTLNLPAVAQTTDTQQHAAHGHQSLDWPGIYYGFPPCTDCEGIKTSLALNKNDSYILIIEYVGKSPREFVEKGKFTWNDDNSTIILTSRDGKNVHFYKAAPDTLTQLDTQGKAFTGKQAERYILRRKDITLEATGHSSSGHGGH